MHVYFKIRYVDIDEYDLDEQEIFITHYLENICRLRDLGFERIGKFVSDKDYQVQKIVLCYELVDKETEWDDVIERFNYYGIHEEFITFVSV